MSAPNQSIRDFLTDGENCRIDRALEKRRYRASGQCMFLYDGSYCSMCGRGHPKPDLREQSRYSRNLIDRIWRQVRGMNR